MADTDRLSPLAKTLFAALVESGIAPVNVTSGYRDPDHNRRVGGAKNSRHIHGDALDISTAGWTDDQRRRFVEFALSKGARGVGIYPGGAIHLDVRQGAPAFWGPGGSYSSQPTEAFPEWARSVVAAARGGAFQPGPTMAAAARGTLAPSPVPLMPGQTVAAPQAPQAPAANPLLDALAGASAKSPGRGGLMGSIVDGARAAAQAAAPAPVQAAPVAGDFGLRPTELASASSAPATGLPSPAGPFGDLASTLGEIVASVGRVRPKLDDKPKIG